MSLLVVGLNHTTAPVEVRERVAFAPEQVPEALRRACGTGGVAEAVILSTCNRTEFIAVTGEGAEAEERVLHGSPVRTTWRGANSRVASTACAAPRPCAT